MPDDPSTEPSTLRVLLAAGEAAVADRTTDCLERNGVPVTTVAGAAALRDRLAEGAADCLVVEPAVLDTDVATLVGYLQDVDAGVPVIWFPRGDPDPIDDLLSLARAGETVGDPEPVDLDGVVEAAWRTVRTADADLLVDVDATVAADENRLRELFENLFRNAVDHGGDDVTVTVGAFEDGLYVDDDGQGIPAEPRESVFEHGYTTSDSGTGFGLAIVQTIAQAHGWTPDVTESRAGGARFEFTGVEFLDEDAG